MSFRIFSLLPFMCDDGKIGQSNLLFARRGDATDGSTYVAQAAAGPQIQYWAENGKDRHAVQLQL